MSSCPDRTLARALLAAVVAASFAVPAAAADYAGIGRAATPKEIAAWDIDVRPDFKGLPKGSGSVAKGMDIWEGKCASCHGVFGESNEVFSPLVGGTTKEDIKTGHAARLTDPGFPGRTTLMKVSSLSTLWDYIHRAMPWNQPKSLSVDEVYAVTAYMLNMGGIIPDDFTLSDGNIAQVQALLPNRNGTTTEHALWPGPEFGKRAPDVKAVACMKDCATEPKVASLLPDHARNAHGNLAQQNRLVGAQHGDDTTRPPPAAPGQRVAAAATAAPATPTAAPASASASGAVGTALLQKNACTACHAVDSKLVGPALREVAGKYAGRADAASYLAERIRSGGSGVWGSIPMPPQNIPEADAKALADWIMKGPAQ